MDLKKILSQLNIFDECQRYNLPLWQCPTFLFLVMGLMIIVSSLITYTLGSRYVADPKIVALIILFLTALLFIIAFVITHSFERLAEANRMKSEFINIVSHQLRSPLSNLKWTLELMMSGRIDSVSEKQLEYFRILKENSDRMRELIKDLLIVSRIETAKLLFKKQEFSLEDLVKKLLSEFKYFADASNVEIEFNPEPDLPKVLTDPYQIKQVIENLLDNAIRYINPAREGIKNKGRIEIDLKKKNKNLYLEIKDNGVGIPKKDQKYIFQKFFRSENVLKYQTQGSGLGLYIAKSIIEKSNGKIGFKSEENKGSTFWFTLPITR